jgi:hypothetical protein
MPRSNIALSVEELPVGKLKELESEILELIESNPNEATKARLIPDLAKKAGWTSSDLWSFYQAKAKEQERKNSEQEFKSEIDELNSLQNSNITLSEFLPAFLAQPIDEIAERLAIRPAVCLTALLTTLSSCHKIGTKYRISEIRSEFLKASER